jgi:glutathione peroxidase
MKNLEIVLNRQPEKINGLNGYSHDDIGDNHLFANLYTPMKVNAFQMTDDEKKNMKEFYDFQVRTPKGEDLLMSAFRGKVLLIVNTATQCGLASQFSELEALHQQYKDQGLVIIGFPCNQFQNQEPETNETMEKSCELNFGVTFQLTEKIMVNGDRTHPIFRYLKDQLPGKPGKRIKWNFTKFLITPEGTPFKRYGPTIKPASIEKDIALLLKEVSTFR